MGMETKRFFYPVSMTEPPAPEKLLQSLFCSCKSGCENSCGCRKTGLYCSTACLNCSGVDCSNSPHVNDLSENSTEILEDASEIAEISERQAELTDITESESTA